MSKENVPCFKVDIKNYQAIEEASLEFTPGITIIKGDTNSGKSAIFRAIRDAVFNRTGDRFIKNGKEFTSVKIDYNGAEVFWKKHRKHTIPTEYKINKEFYSKVGRTQVPEVADVLSIKEVKLVNEKERINFWYQMDKPFLMDKTASHLFEFLSLSSEEDNLTKIVKVMKTDLNTIDKDISELKGNIDSYKRMLGEERAYIDSLEGFKDSYDALLNLEPEVKKYQRVEILAQSCVSILDKLSVLNEKKSDIADVLAGIGDLDEVNRDVLDYKDLSNLVDSLQDTNAKLEEFNKLRDEIRDLTVCGFDPGDFNTKIDDINSIETEIAELKEFIDEVTNIDKDIDKAVSNRGKLQSSLTSIEEELGEYDSCPLCGNPWNPAE